MSRHPLEVLPDVAWREVFKNLGAADCRSCNNSCHYFRGLLKPSAFWWNFHKVLPSIVGKGDGTCAHNVAFRLNKNEILKCRLVCQSWRSAIDDYILRCQRSDVPECNPFCDMEKQNGPDFSVEFIDEDKIDHLLNDLEEYPLSRNDFMWKNVKLGLYNPFDEATEEDVDSFWEKAYLLLQAIGVNISRIWIYSINEISPAGGLALTKIVQRCLTLIPNVNQLCISNEQLVEINGDDYHFKNEIPEVNRYLATNPLPRLPHLKTLVIWELPTHLPISLIQHLTRSYGPQLESLKADCTDAIPSQFNFQILENLTKLEITTLVIEENISINLNFLDNLNCPLQILRLEFHDLEEMSVSDFLVKIQNLRIQELDIKLKMSYHPVPAFTLPKMRYLSLEVGNWEGQEVSFDFLICLPNIEHLKFTWENDPLHPLLGDEQRIHLIGILNNEGNPCESNIWDVLPKLEKITLRNIRWIEEEEELERVCKKRIYTRQEYKQFHKT